MAEPKRPVDEIFPTIEEHRYRTGSGEFRPQWKARSQIVYLSPQQFIDMAAPLGRMDYKRGLAKPYFPHTSSIEAVVELTRLMRGETQMDAHLFLNIDKYGAVGGHEGRHRANALLRMGYKKVPVEIRSDSIKWDQQQHAPPPGPSGEYERRLPSVLISEDGTKMMDSPFVTDGPRRGLPRFEHATATEVYDTPDLPRPRDFDGRDYVGDFLPEIGSPDFPDANREEQWRAEARALRKRDIDNLQGGIVAVDLRDQRGGFHTIKEYEDALHNVYVDITELGFSDIESGFVFQSKRSDGTPFDIFDEDQFAELGEAMNKQGRWHSKMTPEEVGQARQKRAVVLEVERAMYERLSKEYDIEEATREARQAKMTPKERKAVIALYGDDDDLLDMILGKHRVLVEPPPTQLLEESVPPTGARAMASQYQDYPYYVYDQETGRVLSGWEFVEDAQDALVDIEEVFPGRARMGSVRAYKQWVGRIPTQSDWVEGSVVEYLENPQRSRSWPTPEGLSRQPFVDDPEAFRTMYGEDIDDLLMGGLDPEESLNFTPEERRLTASQVKARQREEVRARRIEKRLRHVEQTRLRREPMKRSDFLVLMEESPGTEPLDRRLAAMDAERKALLAGPPQTDLDAFNATGQRLEALDDERKRLLGVKSKVEEGILSRGMEPEGQPKMVVEGRNAPRGSWEPGPGPGWTPDPDYVPEAERTGMVVEGRNVDPEEMIRSQEKRIRDAESAVKSRETGLENLTRDEERAIHRAKTRAGQARAEGAGPKRMANLARSRERSTSSARLAREMQEVKLAKAREQAVRLEEAIKKLRNMAQQADNKELLSEIAAKLAKLHAAAAKLVPVLVVLGDVAFVAELGWNIYKEGSIGGGVAGTGADFVEGVGMIAQAPAALASLLPSHEERQEKGLLTPPEVAAEGLAALGRGVEGTMAPYRRMRTREDRRAHFERTKAFYRELEPNLSEDEIIGLAMRDVSGASTQEAIDDLQGRVSDREVMMDGFPAQSGMMVENIRRSQERDRKERAGLMGDLAMGRPIVGTQRHWRRVLEDSESAGFMGRMEPLSEEEAARAYQGSAQQREDERRYNRQMREREPFLAFEGMRRVR